MSSPRTWAGSRKYVYTYISNIAITRMNEDRGPGTMTTQIVCQINPHQLEAFVGSTWLCVTLHHCELRVFASHAIYMRTTYKMCDSTEAQISQCYLCKCCTVCPLACLTSIFARFDGEKRRKKKTVEIYKGFEYKLFSARFSHLRYGGRPIVDLFGWLSCLTQTLNSKHKMGNKNEKKISVEHWKRETREERKVKIKIHNKIGEAMRKQTKPWQKCTTEVEKKKEKS